jgi:hypothetical protein
VYYGTVQSAVVCTLTRPALVRTHTSNRAFPTGGGLGGFVSFAYGAVGRRGRSHPKLRGRSPSPLFGRGFDVRSRAWLAGSGGRGSGGAGGCAAGGCAAVAAAGGGSGGQRRVLAGVAAVGSGEAGGGSGEERWQRRAVTGSGGRGRGMHGSGRRGSGRNGQC